GVSLALENHPLGLLPDADSIEAFLAGYGGAIGLAYDVSNGASIGEDPIAAIDRLWRHLRIIHLSDTRRREWRHDPLGTGDIDFRGLLKLFSERSYGGQIILEIMGDDPLRGLAEARGQLKQRMEPAWLRDAVRS